MLISVETLQEKMCHGFSPRQSNLKERIGLGMGLTVVQCENGPFGGSLVALDYVISLACSCRGCDKFPGFDKELEVREKTVE